MKMRMVKGIAAALCVALLAPAAAAVMPGSGIVAEAAQTDEKLLKELKDGAEARWKDHQILIDPDGKYTEKLNEIITNAFDSTF